jgi:hypothetical protein
MRDLILNVNAVSALVWKRKGELYKKWHAEGLYSPGNLTVADKFSIFFLQQGRKNWFSQQTAAGNDQNSRSSSQVVKPSFCSIPTDVLRSRLASEVTRLTCILKHPVGIYAAIPSNLNKFLVISLSRQMLRLYTKQAFMMKAVKRL